MIEFYLYFALKREFNKIFGENKPGYEMSVYESFSLKFECLDKVRMNQKNPFNQFFDLLVKSGYKIKLI